jgi:hypothetical protein
MAIQWSTARKSHLMNKVKQNELYGRILMIAIAFIAAAWVSVAWTALTGFTFATRWSRGRVATEQDRTRSRHIAVLTTVIAGPVALWAGMKRRR